MIRVLVWLAIFLAVAWFVGAVIGTLGWLVAALIAVIERLWVIIVAAVLVLAVWRRQRPAPRSPTRPAETRRQAGESRAPHPGGSRLRVVAGGARGQMPPRKRPVTTAGDDDDDFDQPAPPKPVEAIPEPPEDGVASGANGEPARDRFGAADGSMSGGRAVIDAVGTPLAAQHGMEFSEYCQEFASRIIDLIKSGTAPWQKPWAPGQDLTPVSVATGKPYRGANRVRLLAEGYRDPRWLTRHRVRRYGGHVRQSQSPTPIFHWDSDRGFRCWEVFNAEQCVGLSLPPLPERPSARNWESAPELERIVGEIGVALRIGSGHGSHYNLERDEIVIPPKDRFPSALRYHQTLCHELIHATGHPDRMDRKTLEVGLTDGFASSAYAREELVAEIGSMMLGDTLGIGFSPENGSAYVKAWLLALEEDPTEIYHASTDAWEIVEWLLGTVDTRSSASER